ncbi:MAG TPA: hypothetical protein VJ933_10940 [Phaeodactylibacter sp.]|nr:hypothetical protein [Phaeodactylibacter sp.]
MNHCVLLLLLSALPLTVMLGQRAALSDFVDCVEIQYGPDDLLINGRPYRPGHLRAEGHPYFQSEEWHPGTVYLNGQPYPGQQLKYNLHQHQLAIKYERPNGTRQKVVLSELLVDSFHLREHLFVKGGLILDGEEEGGYLEKLFAKDELAFYRFQKKVLSSPSNSKPHGEFRDLKAVFYLSKDGQLHEITKKRHFLACFPAHKQPIKNYMKQHTRRWKKITDAQFAQLLNFCHAQL